ncbi:phosphatase PAP2 family protein [Arthrobacter sp. ATA002]|uniref:phosphatase PAP2 family protein n=1 Tax=Arthrobacter sp. ATA002 TaxID=2991715 RepID=UPI0022A6A78E|nr:phosphatase PAP2 family protein [Arthrobacter sp. ATA002]WAP51786.1 phosphatase PAP2 family protein [Arthrobacter sp. ATA002]
MKITGAGRAAEYSSLRSTRWLVTAGVSLLVLIFSYLSAVWTEHGQTTENAALRGADQVSDGELAAAAESLDNITVYSLALAVCLVALVGLVRRRPDLAFAGVAVIVLGQVITQGLKRFILPRPELVEVSGDFTQNSFPSGHTTIAMTVLFAVFIVVPYRWRGLAALVVLTWAIGIGAYTTTAKWHRFSDTLGADAVALLCGCLAAWWLTRRGSLGYGSGGPRRGRTVFAAVIAAFTALLLALGALLWGLPLLRDTDLSMPDPTRDYTAYLGAHALAAGFSGLTALIFWGLWHRLDTENKTAAQPSKAGAVQ